MVVQSLGLSSDGWVLTAGVGSAQGNDGRREDENAAEQQWRGEAARERLCSGDVVREQVLGAGGGYGDEDGQSQRPADLLGGIEQGRCQSCLVCRYAGIGGGGGPDEDRPEPYGQYDHAR